MVKHIKYPVKIHYPGCKCNHYNDKTTKNTQILVSPFIKADFKHKYFIYDSIMEFDKDKDRFINNCLCTHCDGIYNGGVVIITQDDNNNVLNIENSDELENVRFEKLDTVKDSPDNSHLINNFCKLFPSLLSYYSIIGNTIKNNDQINYTFPKGKISICDKIIDDCCYREFTEETKCDLQSDIINQDHQLLMRKNMNLKYIPLDIIIDNFLMKIIII
jgi:hypothetical protein